VAWGAKGAAGGEMVTGGTAAGGALKSCLACWNSCQVIVRAGAVMSGPSLACLGHP
jgi:hypothetical protein